MSCTTHSGSLNSKQDGFNLVEIMVAMMIFAFTIVAIFSLQTQSSRTYQTSKEESMAALLAQHVMATAEAALENKPFETADKTQNGEGKGAFESYKWAWSLKKITFSIPPLNLVLQKPDDEDGLQEENPYLTMLTQIVNQQLKEALRELTVDVTWQSTIGTGDRKYTLTTHLVDLTKKMAPVAGGIPGQDQGGQNGGQTTGASTGASGGGTTQ